MLQAGKTAVRRAIATPPTAGGHGWQLSRDWRREPCRSDGESVLAETRWRGGTLPYWLWLTRFRVALLSLPRRRAVPEDARVPPGTEMICGLTRAQKDIAPVGIPAMMHPVFGA